MCTFVAIDSDDFIRVCRTSNCAYSRRAQRYFTGLLAFVAHRCGFPSSKADKSIWCWVMDPNTEGEPGTGAESEGSDLPLFDNTDFFVQPDSVTLGPLIGEGAFSSVS